MQYSNEELALMIQAGRVELLPTLWEQVQAFVRQQAARWLAAWQQRRPTLEFDDLYQCGFIALCEAVKTYKADKQAGFIGWLLNYLRTEFAREVGCRTRRQMQEPISNAVSLDMPIKQTDGITLGDAVADSADRYEDLERQIYRQQLQEVMQGALDALPDETQAVLKARYYDGLNRQETARRLAVPLHNIRSKEEKGLHRLRLNKALCEMWYGSRNLYNHTSFAAWKQTGCSVQEWDVMKKDRWENRVFSP